ncbi:putative GIY-YIG superfamily endonuclease [Paenibacillus jamilae]|nr:putative GIY-YIG superfamily endonuclease [Paenibacillus jamilae]
MSTNYNVYMFLNSNSEVIYIGKTKQIIERMEAQHFTKSGHCPTSCYLETSEIWHANTKSESEMAIYEIYLINKYKPKYNKSLLYRDEDNSENHLLPDLSWSKYKKEILIETSKKETKKSKEVAAKARLRPGKDDDLIEAWNNIPAHNDKSDVVREALRLLFFGKANPSDIDQSIS